MTNDDADFTDAFPAGPAQRRRKRPGVGAKNRPQGPAAAPPATGPSRQAAARHVPMGTAYFENNGMPYVQFMVQLREHFKCDSYFEIGTAAGKSLTPVNCKSVAVDPSFKVTGNAIGKKEYCLFFQLGSDAFFAKHNLTSLLGGPFDMAFLDGLHLYEYLLRDFMNTEKHGKRNSVIFMHDCLPRYFGMTTRRQENRPRDTPGWTGDVWKVVPILKKYRPDLVIHLLDCPPTGLVMITNLDPASQVLQKHYFEIVEDWAPGGGDEAKLSELFASAKPVATKGMAHHTDFAKLCWL